MLESKGDFIDGRWAVPKETDGELVRCDPSDRGQEVFRGPWALASVERAVQAARRAQPGWDRSGFEARRQALQRLEAVLEARQEELARQISREMGKPLWEARGEAAALPAKIRIMSTEGAACTAPHRPQGLDGQILHRPLGVLAVLGPFNFPLHLPHGHVVPALLTGNAVVVKPSEVTPGCMQLYAECVEEAGLPKGVFNMVQGPGPVGAKLSGHEQVRGVLFTGSWETGLAIKRATLEQPGKLLALEMGGKNSCLVLEGADLEQAIQEIGQAAFLTTGQRCSATSRVVVHRSLAEALTEGLVSFARRVRIGGPFEEPAPFMGPLVNEAAFEGFLKTQQDDEGGQLEPLLRGAAAREDLDGWFASPGVWRAREVDPRGSHQAREIFGPDVVIYVVDDDEEAVEVANATDYGLAMSVFCRERERFERLAYGLDCGVLNWNRSTVGASSRLPFGGVKRSGNHRPAAIMAGLYCSYPQARLEVEPGLEEGAAGQGPLRYLRED